MSRHQKKRVGILASHLDDRFHIRIIESVLHFFDNTEIEAYVFIGHNIRNSNHWHNRADFIYEMAHSPRLDAVLVIAASLIPRSEDDELSQFLGRFTGVPLILFGLDMPGCRSVVVDNLGGMQKIMDHFTRAHGYREIAFITGPKTHQEAIIRLEGYRKGLECAGIPFDPQLVVQGDFMAESGQEAVKELLDRRGRFPRAILAANDAMLSGVYSELAERRISMPEQIALGGFDNIQDTEFLLPPITTVHQPLEQMTVAACQMLLDILNDQETPQKITLPTSLIIRQSCGCPFHPIPAGPSSLAISSQAKPDSLFAEKPDRHARAVLVALRSHFRQAYPDWPVIEPVILDLLRRIRTMQKEKAAPQQLIGYAQDCFLRSFRAGVSFSVWKSIMQELLMIVRQIGVDHLSGEAYVAVMFRELFILVQELVLIETRRDKNRVSTLAQKYQRLSVDLGDNVTWPDLEKTLLEMSASGSFESIHFFFYADGPLGNLRQLPPSAYPVLSIHQGQASSRGSPSACFPTMDIKPAEWYAQSQFGLNMVYPLYSRDRDFGYILTKVHSRKGFKPAKRNIFDLDQGFGFILSEEIRQEIGLLNHIQELACRTVNNIWLIDELRDTQAKLSHSEKMAALGNLVAGLAHEINTPLGIGITASTYMENLVAVLRNEFADEELTRGDMTRFLDDSQDTLAILKRNLGRSSELVQAFKRVAADQEYQIITEFDLRQQLQHILLSMSPHLRNSPVKLHIDGPQELPMTSYPGAIWQVVSNLIMNCLIHAFEPGQAGEITIHYGCVDRVVSLMLSDNGHGIPSANLPRIFDPFFTTKRGQGGTGLGLSIVFNQVTETLGGTIECKSQPGTGTSFCILMPQELTQPVEELD